MGCVLWSACYSWWYYPTLREPIGMAGALRIIRVGVRGECGQVRMPLCESIAHWLDYGSVRGAVVGTPRGGVGVECGRICAAFAVRIMRVFVWVGCACSCVCVLTAISWRVGTGGVGMMVGMCVCVCVCVLYLQ